MDVKAFWDSRAGLPLTKDTVAKDLEIRQILGYVEEAMPRVVVDMGCGDGELAIEIARNYDADVYGIDFSELMIETARNHQLLAGPLKGRITWQVGDALEGAPAADLTITERCLINLPDWAAQAAAIRALAKRTKALLLCENSRQGLSRLNGLRYSLDLPVIVAPEHNSYLPDELMAGLDLHPLGHLRVDHYSDTYYFLSRVVNAALAYPGEPDYDAPVNRLALKLPALPLGCGQGKIWFWS